MAVITITFMVLFPIMLIISQAIKDIYVHQEPWTIDHSIFYESVCLISDSFSVFILILVILKLTSFQEITLKVNHKAIKQHVFVFGFWIIASTSQLIQMICAYSNSITEPL
jgi:hypothetical protein